MSYARSRPFFWENNDKTKEVEKGKWTAHETKSIPLSSSKLAYEGENSGTHFGEKESKRSRWKTKTYDNKKHTNNSNILSLRDKMYMKRWLKKSKDKLIESNIYSHVDFTIRIKTLVTFMSRIIA